MNIFQVMLSHSKRAFRSTAALYRVDRRGRRELFASGLFLQHLGQHFVVGAAHALVELRTGHVWAGGDETIVELGGPFFHTGQRGQTNFDDDRFDVGFVPLNDDQVSRLKGVAYVSVDQVEREALGPGAHYFAVGFIAKDFRPSVSVTQQMVNGSCLVATETPVERYNELQVTKDTHLLLSFDRELTFAENGRAATPRINGMSGCGIWRRRFLAFQDSPVAILIEHHGHNRNVIVATRLSTIVPALDAFVAGELTVHNPTPDAPNRQVTI